MNALATSRETAGSLRLWAFLEYASIVLDLGQVRAIRAVEIDWRYAPHTSDYPTQ